MIFFNFIVLLNKENPIFYHERKCQEQLDRETYAIHTQEIRLKMSGNKV